MLVARSLLFDMWLYASLIVMGVALAPTLVSRRASIWSMRVYCAQALWMLRQICGVRVEIRGEPPSGPALVAAKHQSFLDVLILMRVLPSPAFVMKRSLAFAPVFGLYALRIGCVPVNRGGGARALRAMTRRLARVRRRDAGAQLVIYPQGARVPPGEVARYRRGVAAVYAEMGDAVCAPAATNAGLFWPRGARWRRPGVAVVAFLDPLPADLGRDLFMSRLEEAIETASARLDAEGRACAEPFTA